MLSTYWLTNLAVLSFEVASDLKLSFIKLTFLLSYFFVKKIPLSRRVEYVMDGSVDQSVSEWEMYVCHTNQIGSTINSQSNFLLKVNGMWEDSIPIQFRTAILEEKVFISSFSVGYAEDFSYGRDEPWGLRQCVSLLYANGSRYFYF